MTRDELVQLQRQNLGLERRAPSRNAPLKGTAETVGDESEINGQTITDIARPRILSRTVQEQTLSIEQQQIQQLQMQLRTATASIELLNRHANTLRAMVPVIKLDEDTDVKLGYNGATDGGSGGPTANFTYPVYTDASLTSLVGAGLSVAFARDPFKLVAAQSGKPCLYYRNASGDYVILLINETLDFEECAAEGVPLAEWSAF